MPFITINNRTLHYLDVGDGPVLLMGHTYLADHAVWREQIRVLSHSYRCIVPDLWGHGLSSAVPGEKVSVRSLAEDYWILMQALDVESYSIVGQAIGGLWGMQMALDYPEKITSLILINPGVIEYTSANRMYYTELLSVVEREKTISQDIIEKLIPLFFSQNTQTEKFELTVEFENNLLAMQGANLSTIVDMGRNIMAQPTEADRFGEIAVPTLILAGEHARICSAVQSRRLSTAIEGANMHMIPKAGHLPCLEQPEIVNLHLKDFLARVYADLRIAN